MNLPTAPPAFDATTGPRRQDRADLGADIGIGCALVFLEILALAVVFGLWFLSGFNLDPATTVRADSLWGYLAAVGGVGALAVVATAIAARARAYVTVASQSVVAAVVSLALFGGYVAQSHEDAHCETAPNACHEGPSKR
ncbi:DUF6234 family protein [Streptomyces sp. SID10815]|uniref:DUF6234 family protein n=1 Tax=Streptomyces similanensis TaxID=1274988 RepID=A0ABP9JWD4_9ACTN|nr:DUF6234 family protein [Streptomyces sp. SID10815]NEA47799.1 hypothetical protein [Streptomyces sp. SID10815]